MGFIQNIRDFRNFLQFKKDVKSEMKRAKSKMTIYNIKRNWLGNILYVQINCTDADLMNNDYDHDRMLLMRMKPIVDYLSGELGWGEYLVPQINNFVDDEGNSSLSYGVLFIFTGYSLTMTKFLIYSILNLGILGAGIWALFRYVL